MDVLRTWCRACQEMTVVPSLDPLKGWSHMKPDDVVYVSCLLRGHRFPKRFKECELIPNDRGESPK